MEREIPPQILISAVLDPDYHIATWVSACAETEKR